MKILLSHFSRIILGATIFCILYLEISLTAIISGAIAGLVFSLLASRIERNRPGFWGFWSLKYFIALFCNMVLSTIKLTKAIFAKTPPSVVIKTEDAKTSSKGQVIVSNSITLTPGTLTLEQRDDRYTILMVCDGESNSEIASTFEKNIK